MHSSAMSKFYTRTPDERLESIKKFSALTTEEISIYRKHGFFEPEFVDYLSENVFASHPLPLSVATNFIINNRETLVPMVIEEIGVVAGASVGAKLCRNSGGFKAYSYDPIMIGQILLTQVENCEENARLILDSKRELIEFAKSKGYRVLDLETRIFETFRGSMLCVYVHVNVGDRVGANTTRTVCESLAPKISSTIKGNVRLCLQSNLATQRLVNAKAIWRKKDLDKASKNISGKEIIENILDLSAYALSDPFRACTHNKGILNGIDALAVATCNDWRLIESGAHAYASLSGRYSPLTSYHKTLEGDLIGQIEVPIAMGIQGGAIDIHPFARNAIKMMGIKTAKELGEVAASIGLSCNFAALRAISTGELSSGDARLNEMRRVKVGNCK